MYNWPKIITLFAFLLLSSMAQENINNFIQTIKDYDDSTQVRLLTKKSWEYRNKEPKLAQQYGFAALKKYASISDKGIFCETYNFIGVIYGDLGKLDSSLHYYNLALELAKEYNDSSQIAYSFNNIGDYYYKVALFSIALENIFQAYNIFEKLNEERGMAYALNDIGEIYLIQKDYPKALNYFSRSAEIRFFQKDYRSYARTLINIATTNMKAGNADKALSTYEEALIYSKKANYIKGNSWVLSGKSEIYFERGQFDKALDYRLEALEIDIRIKNKYGEIANYNHIGAIYLGTGLYSEGRKYLLKALEEGKLIDYRDQVMVSYKLLRELSIKTSNYKEAHDFLEKFKTLEDSIYGQESANQIADLQSAFATERKVRENELLKKELEFEGQAFNFLLLISFLILGVVVLFVSKFRSERKINKKLNDANQELNELNAQKDKLFSIIGHDLKNPVGSIRNFLEILYTDYNGITEKEKIEFIEYAYVSSKRLTTLLLELLEWGRISRGLVKIKSEEINLEDILIEITELLRPAANDKKIEIIRSNCNQLIYTDENMIKTVLRNLISNAIKFTPERGKISISYFVEKDYHCISIKDNGVGIPEVRLQNLFKIDNVDTTVGTKGEVGTGLGLPMTNDFVKKCNGSIRVESKLNKGSNFIISLPNTKSELR